MTNLYINEEGFSNKIFNGLGSIQGILRIDNVPAQRRILLIDQISGKTIAMTFSDINGNYIFTNLELDRLYTVIGIDDEGVKNSDIISNKVAVIV